MYGQGRLGLKIDWALLRELTVRRLRTRGTYVLAGFVGLLINLYGQLLVPWLRGASATEIFLEELETSPGVTAFSVFLGFAFPFGVGLYSAVTSSYTDRRRLAIADFPEKKPDPVFRAAETGEVLEAGAMTVQLFAAHGITNARQILGDELWEQIVGGHELAADTRVRFAAADATYLVRHAPAEPAGVNVYLTRLAG